MVFSKMASFTCAVPQQGDEGWAPPELLTRALHRASAAGRSGCQTSYGGSEL